MNCKTMIKKLTSVLLSILISMSCIITSVSPAQAGTPIDSYAPERYFVSNDSTTLQTTGTSPETALTLTFTSPAPATKDFLVLATAITNNADEADYTLVQLTIDGSPYSISNNSPVNASVNWRTFEAFKVMENAGGSSHTIKIEYCSGSGAQASIKNVSLAVLEISNYGYVDESAENTTDTTVETQASLEFTPSQTADYLLFFTANMKSSADNKAIHASANKDGTPYAALELADSHYNSCARLIHETGLSHESTYTFTVTYYSESGGIAYIKDTRILAVLASDLGDHYYNNTSLTGGSTTSTSYVDEVSLELTGLSGTNDYLIIGGGLGQHASKGGEFDARLSVNGTYYNVTSFEAPDRNFYKPFLFMRKVNFTPGSPTIKIQYQAGTAGTVSVQGVSVVVIKANTCESYDSSDHDTVDDVFDLSSNLYLWANGLGGNTTCDIAYYDADGAWVATDADVTSGSYGNLSSNALATSSYSGKTEGWGYGVVFADGLAEIPSTYSSATASAKYIMTDRFCVTSGPVPPIPEWPTIGLVSVGILIVVGYFWLRNCGEHPLQNIM